MAVDQAIRESIAADLWQAERTAQAIDRPSDSHDLDVVDAYEIQLINIRRRLDAGAKIVGHKVGLASEAMQKMMNVDEPDYGHLLDEMKYFEDRPIDTATLCFPRVEVEVGFILGEDLPSDGCTNEDVVAAIEWVVPSIELIDSRIKDWKITLPDTIADNASSCGWILGQERVPLADLDVGNIDATLERNGEIVAKGNSSAVLGNPLNSVFFLARTVGKFGVQLRKGDVILPGTATKAFDIASGDHFVAEFADLGRVTLDFT
ncbi:2-keto-4-pentenoate hydratase [Gordonia sp. ABSL1-1]|uniref:2-keto-4-pentenoate hydratase n=1 Tax=Gordonia sp. ABSL1-1 TaxID=3053923 RepID=UPI002573654D|nr:2-keto-4-pentenoate hydratase [Gordonia sp. ABSL1-1]MDL9938063.1 2-keto-4-pentenoate hydratase [Gordonia sp. ABSL1-1]